MFSNADIAYLAGIVDGEGSIGLGVRQRKYVTPTLQISNTNRILIDWLLTIGGTAYATKEARPNRKRCWLWRMAGSEARELIRTIRPFLKLKTAQADIVLAILPLKGGQRLTEDKLVQNRDSIVRIRELNRRGVSKQAA